MAQGGAVSGRSRCSLFVSLQPSSPVMDSGVWALWTSWSSPWRRTGFTSRAGSWMRSADAPGSLTARWPCWSTTLLWPFESSPSLSPIWWTTFIQRRQLHGRPDWKSADGCSFLFFSISDSFLGGPDLACRADCVDRDILANSTSFTHLVWYLAATISLLCETFFPLAIDPLIGANLCSTWQFQFIFQGWADLGKHTSRPWSPWTVMPTPD